MLTIPGYDIFEQIHAGRNSLVFRGMHLSGNRPVILKVPAREYPSARELARFFNEFEILQTMDVPGVVRVHAMEKVGHGHVLILEDFDARPLSQLLDQFERNIELTLELALSLVGTLERIHARGIVHKDIKLENILINRSQGQIKLTDFGIASLISRESQSLQNPDSLEGTLEYMSPEQTGRINRAVDYRSDYYSLGVVLYRLLTGGLPFPFDDPLELVHAHIARVPTPPIDKEPGIPLPLSAMVMKLLAKTPEERYQSAAGIREDLRLAIKHQFAMSTDSVVEERFTRLNDREIHYEFTVTDDSIYSQPWRGEMTLRATDGPIYEYACHEGNYALPNILSGARQEEES